MNTSWLVDGTSAVSQRQAAAQTGPARPAGISHLVEAFERVGRARAAAVLLPLDDKQFPAIGYYHRAGQVFAAGVWSRSRRAALGLP
jgi:hypothetical protein